MTRCRIILVLIAFCLAELCGTINAAPCTTNPVADGSTTVITQTVPKTSVTYGSIKWRVTNVVGSDLTVTDCNIDFNPPCTSILFGDNVYSSTMVTSGSNYRVTLTIHNVNRGRDQTTWRLASGAGYANVIGQCDLDVYSFQSPPVCQNLGISSDGNTVSWTCTVSNVYPEMECRFEKKRRGRGSYQWMTQNIDTQITTTEGNYPPRTVYHDYTCTMNLPVSQLGGEVTHQFRFTAAVVKGSSTLKTSSPIVKDLNLAYPQVYLVGCPNAYDSTQGYISEEDNTKTCQCRLKEVGNPPGVAQWLDAQGSLVGQYGSLSLVYNPDAYPQVYLVGCPNAYDSTQGYISEEDNTKTCQCRLKEVGNPPGVAQWLDAQGSLVGQYGSLSLVYNPDAYPQVYLVGCPNAYDSTQGYISEEDNTKTCQCRLKEVGNPPGVAQWLDAQGSLVGQYGSLSLVYNPDDQAPTYTCRGYSGLGPGPGIVYEPKFAYGSIDISTKTPSEFQCTKKRGGMPVCIFDKSFCGYQIASEDGNHLEWKRMTSLDLPLGLGTLYDWKKKTGSFVYLDVMSNTTPIGSKSRLSGWISNPKVKAVCIEIHYATTADTKTTPTINIYNHILNGPDILIGRIQENTQGGWKVVEFHACIASHSEIAFESEKISNASIVALDYFDIRHANMDCSNFSIPELPTTSREIKKSIKSTSMTEPTKPTTTSTTSKTEPVKSTTTTTTTSKTEPTKSTTATTTTTRTAKANPTKPTTDISTKTPTEFQCTNIHAGMQACNFDRGYCFYEIVSENGSYLEWKRTTSLDLPLGLGTLYDWKKKKTGSFAYLDVMNENVPVGSKSRLISRILTTKVKAVCIEIHYATTADTKTTPNINIYNHILDGPDILIGRIQENTQGRWKVVEFHACVGDYSEIAFESEKISYASIVALDYLDIRHANMDCSNFKIPESPTTETEAMKSITTTTTSMTEPSKPTKTTSMTEPTKSTTTSTTSKTEPTKSTTATTTTTRTAKANPTKPTTYISTKTPTEFQCTNIHAGMQACNFDRGYCFYEIVSENGSYLEWKRTTSLDLPLGLGTLYDWKKKKTGSFAYLDVMNENVPVGSKSRLISRILSTKVKAVCIEIHYATTADTKTTPTINIYNHILDGPDILIGRIQENTQGRWKVVEFHACVGDYSEIAFESEKISYASIVALDYLDIRHANMDCSNFKIPESPTTETEAMKSITTTTTTSVEAYPTKPTTDISTKTPSEFQCTKKRGGMPVCIFDKSWCGYKIQSEDWNHLEWKRTTSLKLPLGLGTLYDWKKKKTGSFVFLDVLNNEIPVGSKSRLSGPISYPKVKAVCIEIHYATTADTKTIPTINIYNHILDGSDILIGRIQENTQGRWKVVEFHACVGEHSEIAFESEKISPGSTVALDHFDIRQAYMDCSKFSIP